MRVFFFSFLFKSNLLPFFLEKTILFILGFPGGSGVKASAWNSEIWTQSLGREDPLEKEMATHSSILAWKIPWTEEPGRLQYTGSQRVRHHWATSLSLFIVVIWASRVALVVKNLPANVEDTGSLAWEHPLEKEIATHSSILALKIPWTLVHVSLAGSESDTTETT